MPPLPRPPSMNRTRLLLMAAFAAVPATAAPVINEIHNPDAVPATVAGWHLTDGIDFTFPSCTTIPAGGYVLVAENPAAFLTQFARTALLTAPLPFISSPYYWCRSRHQYHH